MCRSGMSELDQHKGKSHTGVVARCGVSEPDRGERGNPHKKAQCPALGTKHRGEGIPAE